MLRRLSNESSLLRQKPWWQSQKQNPTTEPKKFNSLRNQKSESTVVDSGITTIPRFFIHPPDALSAIRRSKLNTKPDPDIIPIIDLCGADSEQLRPTIVEKIACAQCAAWSWVFFRLVITALEWMFWSVWLELSKGFHELPPVVKAQFYDYLRDRSRGVSFSNVNIFHSTAASWR